MNFIVKKQRNRLILIDLDGTTLNNDGKTLNTTTKLSLKKAINDGHIVCIVTGRPYRGSINFYHELGLDTLLCNFNGSHIHDPKRKKFKRIIFSIAEEIVNSIFQEKAIYDNIYNAVIEHHSKAACWKKDDFFETYFHLSTVAEDIFIIDKNEVMNWQGDASAILIQFKPDTDLAPVWRALAKYSNAIKVTTWKLHNTGLIFEISNKLINKGIAAKILAQYYNIDIRDVIAYGDEINDKEMLETVGYGIAMKNGNIVTKSVAKDITSTNNDEGGVGLHLTNLLFELKQ